MLYIPGGNNRDNGRLLSKALEDYLVINHYLGRNGNAASIQLDSSVFEHDANRFISDFMRDKFPARKQFQWWNSSPVRKALYNLPWLVLTSSNLK